MKTLAFELMELLILFYGDKQTFRPCLFYKIGHEELNHTTNIN